MDFRMSFKYNKTHIKFYSGRQDQTYQVKTSVLTHDCEVFLHCQDNQTAT